MANRDGSTGGRTGDGTTGITREDWQALGFEVRLDGTLYLSTDDAPLVECEVVPMPLKSENWCTCCGIDNYECGAWGCPTGDCSACSDPDCLCCTSPHEGPARPRA